MRTAHLIFPHHLFKNTGFIGGNSDVYLIEEFNFFRKFNFHRQKLVFHRASMKAYQNHLSKKGFQCTYLHDESKESDVGLLIAKLKKEGFGKIACCNPCDTNLEKKIRDSTAKHGLETEIAESPLFINKKEEIEKWFKKRKKYFQTAFYIDQRKKRKILTDPDGKPMNGKWSFDSENRLKYPGDKTPPKFRKLRKNRYYSEAENYVGERFNENCGNITGGIVYPCTHRQAENWLDDFLKNRFTEFGPYEDAIKGVEVLLHHSLLSPLLNTGLLLPMQVIKKAVSYASKNKVPFNSLEGFVRQILGWREFVRAVYLIEGDKQRKSNFWGFERKIPASFYSGTTGIGPIDLTIGKLLDTGYNHHIERLMVMSNFMLLCEFHPDEVYRWFMEMYIDAYDWVMVPNVYGMGQLADGGMMCTKPYISGSNYLFKMSDYKRGEPWAETWDALFWRFINVHRAFIQKNPRMALLVNSYDRMDDQKKKKIMEKAGIFLNELEK